MSRLPPLPDLEWKDDGTPIARDFDDIYFSREDGLDETRNVFLMACGLPERWRDRQTFTIAELGFGTGLNFLGLIECWLNSEKRPDAWLHFVSVEKFLMTAEDAARVLRLWPEVSDLAEILIANWPVRAKGLQRISFPDWQVTLTLYVGDVEDWLDGTDFTADAWFLDGFAPAKNETMWGEGVFAQMAVHSAPGCKVGTFTVAGSVRRGLSAAGFYVSKQPGFGHKRERLEAIWPGKSASIEASDLYLSTPTRKDISKVVVIGAGIAGACIARSFALRGLDVTVLDQADGPASGASGNPYGLVMPRLDAADTPQARLLLHTYLHARRYYASHAADEVHDVDVIQKAQNEKEAERFAKLIEDPPLDASLLTDVSEFGETALCHHKAALSAPARLVPLLLTHPKITRRYEVSISDIGTIRSKFDDTTLFVIASGWRSGALLPQMNLPLTGKMGQIDWGELASDQAGFEARASGTYALKAEGNLLFGATFESIGLDESPDVSGQARSENLEGLRRLAPDWVGEVNEASLKSRASVRGTTPDRMPIAGVAFDDEQFRAAIAPLSKGASVSGSLPHHADIYVLTGLGARGFTFAPLLADLIVSQALGEPSPLARPELEQVSPVRFAVRAVRRGQ